MGDRKPETGEKLRSFINQAYKDHPIAGGLSFYATFEQRE